MSGGNDILASFRTIVSDDLIKKVAGGLLERYTSDPAVKLALGALMPDDTLLAKGITRLLKEGALNFGERTQPGDFTDSLLNAVSTAIDDFQKNSSGKLSVTGLFDKNTITRLLKRPSCGGIEGRKLDPGPPIETLSNGKHVLRYFLEGLPNVGSLKEARKSFMRGMDSWENKLNVEISEELREKRDANLVVSVAILDADDSVLALTDVGSGGPNQGGQLKMVFDKAEQWTPEMLQITTAHELGHALGIRHADVRQPNCLMNDTLDLGIKEPQEADIAAAVSKGWKRR